MPGGQETSKPNEPSVQESPGGSESRGPSCSQERAAKDCLGSSPSEISLSSMPDPSALAKGLGRAQDSSTQLEPPEMESGTEFDCRVSLSTAIEDDASPPASTSEQPRLDLRRSIDCSFGPEGMQLDLGPTLAYMQYRKIHRQFRGQYTKARTLGTFFVVAIMILIALFDDSSASYDPEEKSMVVITIQYHIFHSKIMIAVFTLVLITIAANLFLMNHYNMKWGYTHALLFLLTQIAILIAAGAGLPCTCLNLPCTSAVVVMYGILTFLYLSFSIVAREFFPAIASMHMFAPKIIGKSKEHEEMDLEAVNPATVDNLLPHKPHNLHIASGSFCYRGPFFWNTRTHICRYRGTVNEEGIPHGYGSWIDTHWQGETLEGFWEDGLPVGPFTSRETGSGSGFTCIRIAYFLCRADGFDHSLARFTPKHGPIGCGVASVECCVAGAFFREYPKVDLLWEETGLSNETAYEGCAEDLVQHLQTLLFHMSFETKANDDFSPPLVLRAHPRRGIQVSGHYRTTSTPRDSVTVTVPVQVKRGRSTPPNETVSPENSLMHRGWSTDGSFTGSAGSNADRELSEATWSMGRNSQSAQVKRPGSFKRLTTMSKQPQEHHNQHIMKAPQLAEPAAVASPSAASTSESGMPAARSGSMLALEKAKAASAALQERIAVSRDRIAETRRRMLNSFSNRFVSSTPVHRSAVGNTYLKGIKKTRKKTRGRQVKYHSVSMGLIQQVTHDSEDERRNSLSGQPRYERRLEIPGWIPYQGLLGVEILIHIHGYNTPLQFACQTLAQLWSFGNFPSHIKPVIFSWPTGRLFAYPLAQSRGAEADSTVAAFKEMILGFARVGVRIFHFQTHSMGGRAFLHALPEIKSLFITREEAYMRQSSVRDGDLEDEDGMNQGLRMATVTLMNPEYGTHKFVEVQASILKSLCENVTIYGDLQDVALILTYYWNNTRSRLMRHNREVFIPDDVQESWQGLPPWACCWRVRDTVLGLDIYDIKDRDGRPLDIDIIDCTFLQSNVQEARHTSFTLNRSVVEDLYDVIVHRIPAQERAARLEPRGGNVYSFRVAPSYVTRT